MIIGSLATTSDDFGTVKAALMGEKTQEDWEFLKTGADAFYAALEFIPIEQRADLLVALGWTRWMESVQWNRSIKDCGLRIGCSPGRRLSERLNWVILRGQVAASDTSKHC